MKSRKRIWQPETAAYKRFQFPVHKIESQESSSFADSDRVDEEILASAVDNETHLEVRNTPDPAPLAADDQDITTLVTNPSDVRTHEKQIVEEIYKKGYEEGKRLGFDEAIQQSAKQTRKQSDVHLGLAEKLTNELENLKHESLKNRDKLSAWLGQLIEQVCRQVIRREINTKKDQIITVIRETLELIPDKNQYAIHVNEQDAELLMAMKPDFGAPWQVVVSKDLLPGDCRIETADAEAEAHLETRLIECLDIIRESLPLITDMDSYSLDPEVDFRPTEKIAVQEAQS